MNANYVYPKLINLELTDMCPLNCKQCYCSLNNGKYLLFETAEKIIKEASQLSVDYINLSGGESLLYPHLNQVIALCTQNNIVSNIAISGWNFDQHTYTSLKSAGLSNFFISLNGSTNHINSQSRNGFYYSLNALDILSKNQDMNVYINWIMQSNNAFDFPNIVKLAEFYKCKCVTILGMKPNNSSELINYPTLNDFEFIYNFLKHYSGNVQIIVDNCFSQLKTFLGRQLFGNSNIGILRGCTAGIDSIAVNVDGDFIPCRHLNTAEKFPSIKAYWNNSKILNDLRLNDYYSFENCPQCSYVKYCKPCISSTYNKQSQISELCPLSCDH